MEEKDVVKGLFEDKIADVCAGSVRSALLAEDEGQWVAAGDHYKDCIGQGSAIENFLYEACFKVILYLVFRGLFIITRNCLCCLHQGINGYITITKLLKYLYM